MSQTLQESLNLSVSVHKTAACMGIATLFLVAAISMSAADTSTSSTGATQKKSSHPASSKTSTHKGTKTSSHTNTKSSSHKGKKSKTATKRGQQNIDADRTHQIQTALIREHYLDGEPSGKWDDATQKAMQKYQADNGWQNKTVPDSRALIKMGLGPNQDHLLNPESAMTTTPSQHPASAGPNAASVPAVDGQPQR